MQDGECFEKKQKKGIFAVIFFPLFFAPSPPSECQEQASILRGTVEEQAGLVEEERKKRIKGDWKERRLSLPFPFHFFPLSLPLPFFASAMEADYSKGEVRY